MNLDHKNYKELSYLEPNLIRGFIALVGMSLTVLAAYLAWNWEIAVFVAGVFIYIEAAVDEVVERISLIKRIAK